MAWSKSPPALVALFDSLLPGPPVERRKMFGYPSAFVNGNLFMGLFQEDWVVRLGDRDREALAALGAGPFEPMAGRPMRGWVKLPREWLEDPAKLRPWIQKALKFGSGLPPKAAKAKLGGSAGAKRPAGKTARTARAVSATPKAGRPTSGARRVGASSRSRAKPRKSR
jgi:TfoX/Sxy family transcriptional regulator of competence genes